MPNTSLRQPRCSSTSQKRYRGQQLPESQRHVFRILNLPILTSQTWITATQALLVLGCFKPGDNVLWHAGASAVSIAGIQLAKATGAKRIFVTAGSDHKVEFCIGLGATAGFKYNKEDWVKGILDATDGHGVDVIVDFIGKNYSQGNFEAAAVDGKIVQLASLSGSRLEAGLDIGLLQKKNLRWRGAC